MESPAEEAKFLMKIDNVWDIASFTLFEKYIIQNLRGKQKLWEIQSTDMETLVIALNKGYPIPGLIYTFIYKGPEMVLQLRDGDPKEFTDFIPIVFCMNTGPGWFNGINLNMLPAGPRLDFLQNYYELYKKFFKDVERKTQNNKLAINNRFIDLIKGGEGQNMIKIFNKKSGANFNYGFRKYLIEKVDNLRMIEYSEWSYLPFYRPAQAFRTMPVDQIHKLYYRSQE